MRRLAQQLSAASDQVVVYSLRDSDTASDIGAWSGVRVETFRPRGPATFGFSPELRRALLIANDDVLVTHGLWKDLSRVATDWNRRCKRPYIANPHGMLDPWAIGNSWPKKRMAGLLYENRHLRQASCIRALCSAEVEAIRAYGLTTPVCMIPNGVDLPDNAERGPRTAPWCDQVKLKDHKILFYLGRLHPKKNLPNLLQAWKLTKAESRSDSVQWKMVIGGWDELGHGDKLQRLAKALGIENDVHFAGQLYGPKKAAAYSNADAFVLPSVSAGLPMAALEAHAYRLPAVLTRECNLPETCAAGAAIPIRHDATDTLRRLEQLFAVRE